MKTRSESAAGDQLLALFDRLRKLGLDQNPLEESGVSVPQLALLDWVAACSGCGIQQIADGLDLTPPTVSVGVRRLEKAGVLERQPNPQDGRSIRLFLTPQGETLYRRAQDFRRGRVRRLLSGLTPQEQETLLDLWERALGAVE